MPFSEAVRIALTSLRAHKLRSFLTVLGILIGVSSVVAVVAIINGLDRYVGERVLELGSRSFSLQRIPAVVMSAEVWVQSQRRRWLTLQDMEAVRRACPDCLEVGAQTSTGLSVRWGRTVQEDVQLVGITENVSRIGAVRDLAAGRHLIQDDVDRGRPVAVIGMDLVDAFFGSMEPLGKTISVAGFPVKVIGVAERKGSVFGNSQDNFVWIPITLYFRLQGRRSVVIQAEATSMETFEAAQDQARLALRARRHLRFNQPDDFALETGESILTLWQSATAGIYAATLLVTGMSLVVGGIVVMNIMLVSVTERTSEIGVRKALGARRRDIERQFLVEAVVLSVCGGALGVAGASVFAFGLGKIIGAIMSADFVAPIRGWAVLLALAVSTGVGLVAGLYPARRAAAMDPVTALRAD